MNKYSEPLPKNPPGSLHLEFKRCGRRQCRCQRGLLHGPYIYRHWRDGGRQRKAYVPMRRLSEILIEIQHHRADAIQPWEIIRMMKELYRA
jgi:Family of unknown function (DUF6788)